ncbi:hypothetical protein A0256_05585 [Mucilaginibacter sp. PAMC 26640]|nr:hypothetical protein A0256_05585 [Mucilaginibacter sp. PAMC 26640]
MRYLILFLFCTLHLTASAQWWRGDFKNHPRYPAIALVQMHSVKRIPSAAAIVKKLPMYKFPRTVYNLQLSEGVVMRSAQHHMRYRQYDLASYNFSELAELYVQENRLSEAKWYYLQSIQISKRMADDQHTIKSLISLAMVKADLGDLPQAGQDLSEARTLAVATGRIEDIITVDKKIAYVKSNKIWLDKSEWRYAENAEIKDKKK